MVTWDDNGATDRQAEWERQIVEAGGQLIKRDTCPACKKEDAINVNEQEQTTACRFCDYSESPENDFESLLLVKRFSVDFDGQAEFTLAELFADAEAEQFLTRAEVEAQP